MNRSVDILIPTYNRKKFSKEIVDNINRQDYPFINRIIVADDGECGKLDMTGCKYVVEYFNVPRMTIGTKRNFLMSKAKSYYMANMDTDDFYQDCYISSCIFNLLKSGKSITGSADMICQRDNEKILHRCVYLHLLNEATIVCQRETDRRYGDTSKGEGGNFLEGYENDIIETDINKIMICLVHSENTVDKSSLFNKK